MRLAIRSAYCKLANRSLNCILPSLLNSSTNSIFSSHLRITSARFSSINVAIVGSGPAGFYTAQKLLKESKIAVDIYEKLPVPFGLVRYGVAPDHQEVKNVINSFTTVANNERVNFYGNVNLGQDIVLNDLIESYHAVILCYGSAQDKMLGIEGEDSKNTISARNFVGWYNGVPEDKDLNINLDCDTACIIGQGNVALDCARVLINHAKLDKTDITSYAQKTLRQSKVKRIYIIGRRGPIQTAFTIKELRELVGLNGRYSRLEPSSVFRDYSIGLKDLSKLTRPRRRLIELLLNLSAQEKRASINDGSNHVECIFKFFSKPTRIHADFKTGQVCQLELQQTKYESPEAFMSELAKPIEVDEFEEIDCGLVIRSIGYKAVMVDPNLPKDRERGALLNTNGRVHGFNSLYCSGWLATGATGVIAGTLNSSHITAQSVLDDISSGCLVNVTRKKPGSEYILNLLRKKSVQVVHFNDWLKIDQLEKNLGSEVGKNREKLVDKSQMLEVAQGLNVQTKVD